MCCNKNVSKHFKINSTAFLVQHWEGEFTSLVNIFVFILQTAFDPVRRSLIVKVFNSPVLINDVKVMFYCSSVSFSAKCSNTSSTHNANLVV